MRLRRDIVATCLAAAAVMAGSPARATAQAPFTATVTPNPIVLTAGGVGVTVRVSTTTTGTFREPIVYGFSGLPAGISTGGDRTVAEPYPQVAFTFQAGAGVAAGTYAGTLQGTTSAGSVSVPVTVTVQAPAAPTVHTISPPAVVTGSRRNVLTLHGANFAPGAVITSRAPGVEIVSARVLGSSLAEVVVSVRPEVPPGRYGLELRNPGGSVAPASAGLIVQRSSALGAPLTVNAVRILAPGPTQIITPGDPVHAHALLATSGIGTIVGTWRVDGVPFERFTRVVSAGRPLEVRSTLPIPTAHMGEHTLELVIDNPTGMQTQQVTFFQSRDSRTALRVIAPVAGDAPDLDDVRLRWTLVPGAAAYQVELAAAGTTEPDSADVLRRRFTANEWRPSADLLRSIGTTRLRVRVRAILPGDVHGAATPWTPFEIVLPDDGIRDPPPAPPPDAPPARGPSTESAHDLPSAEPYAAPPHAPRRSARVRSRVLQDSVSPGAELLLSVQGALTSTAANTDAPPTLGRIQLSGQTDVAGRVLDHQATGDLSLSHDLGSPWDGREESRNWIARLGAPSGVPVRPGVTVGYASPAHFDRTELLSVAGATVTGVQAALESDVGTAAFYRSVRFGGAPELGGNVEISTAAIETSDHDRRFVMRALALHAQDNGIEGFAPGGVGRAAGAIATLDLGRHLRLTGEAAFGEYEPGDSLGTARDGGAVKVSADGSAAGFGYTLRVAHTGEGFVNPANPGFTPAGVSGLTQAELTVSRALVARAAANVWFSHTRGGIAAGAGDPSTTDNSARIGLSVPLAQNLTASLSGNLTVQDGSPVAELAMPATDRTQRGVELSLSWTLGGFALTPNATWQDVRDRAMPDFDQRVVSAGLTASGPGGGRVLASATVHATRIDADPLVGRTDQWLLAVQPTLALDEVWLSVAPRISLSHTTNALQNVDQTSTHYGVAARWAPPWAGSIAALELASDWTRDRSGFDPVAPFVRRTLLTIGLNWRGDRRWTGRPQ